MTLTNEERAELRKEIAEEIARSIATISMQIGELKGELRSHNDARFAHNWDHQMLTDMKAQQNQWETWRDGINRWRWTMAGAVGLLFFEINVFGALVVTHVSLH